MRELVTYLVSGIALGSSFALIGSGFVVVHRVTRVVNFAQGSIAVVGGDAVGLAAGRPAAARAGRGRGGRGLRGWSACWSASWRSAGAAPRR